MNNATHTPGPWVVEGSDITNDYPDQGSRILIAEKVAIESDANLIAAAPAMYEALQTLVEYLSTQVPADTLDDWKHVFAARQALAQAEGK